MNNTAARSLTYILGGTVALLLISLWLGITGSNRLVSLNFEKNSRGEAEVYLQEFELDFTRNLKQIESDELNKLIVFEPAIKGRAILLGNKIKFTPSEPLNYGTEYKLTIDRNLQDVYGKTLPRDLVFTIRTKKSQFLYKFTDGDKSELRLGTISPADLGIETAVIVSNANIREYIADYQGNYIAYTLQPQDTPEQNATELYLYNLATKTSTRIDLSKKLYVYSLQFSKSGELYFLGNIANESLSAQDKQNWNVITAIYRYDRQKGELSEVQSLEPHFLDAVDIFIPPVGNAIFIQKFIGDFMIADIATGESTLLTKINAFGGTSHSGSVFAGIAINEFDEIFNPAVRVLSQQGEIFSTEPATYTKDPALFPDGNRIAYAERYQKLDLAEGLFNVLITDIEQKSTLKKITALSGSSLELPEVSPDASWLSYETVKEEELTDLTRPLRLYVNPGRPTESQLTLLNLQTGGQMDLGQGYNLVWIY